MGLRVDPESSAALVFLVLYSILLVFLLLGYLTRRLKFCSRYTVILLHVMVRLASQCTGLMFGIKGYSDQTLLLTSYILSAEGHFTLVLCTYRFLVSWLCHNSTTRLEPRHLLGTPFSEWFRDSFRIFRKDKTVGPMAILNTLLTFSNTLIIVGALLVIGSNARQAERNMPIARDMRVLGQSVFLCITIYLLFCIIDSIHQYKQDHPDTRVHPTLYLLLATWPCLFVRGLYGILSPVVTMFNFLSPSNSGPDGLTDGYVISEYLLSTTMEWISCALLMMTYVSSRNDQKKGNLKERKDVRKEPEQIGGQC